MTTHTKLLQTIDSIVTQTLSVIEMMEEISPGDNNFFADYKKNCSQIPMLIQSGLIRIAVVGVIKSGKSTFINSLAGKELVKRGAGVVTSITTRIRKGKKNEAVLVMKSWDEINNILKKTLDMFPHDGQGAGVADTFDLRRKKDR
ncbi:MAG: dynamin family protein, partial [Desulfobacteraceae bacterium]|nr:dynamin family protein [Desulfobacteraceae bacterium]